MINTCAYLLNNHVCLEDLLIFIIISLDHRLSINRPTKRGKENSRSDGHCQCEKEMEDHLLACKFCSIA
jgi:hypothetical protein